jgi:hypothetical protein
MEHKRYQTMEEVVSSLHEWLNKFRGNSYMCQQGTNYNFACSSMLLGALTKELDRISCLDPRPEVPFQQLSFEELCANVLKITTPTWSLGNQNGYYYQHHGCSFDTTVKDEVKKISNKLAGLNLSDFKDRSDEQCILNMET